MADICINYLGMRVIAVRLTTLLVERNLPQQASNAQVIVRVLLDLLRLIHIGDGAAATITFQPPHLPLTAEPFVASSLHTNNKQMSRLWQFSLLP